MRNTVLSNHAKNERDRLLILLLERYGLKVKEVLDIKHGDVTPEHLILDKRKVSLDAETARSLRSLSKGYLFSSKFGIPLSSRRVEQIVCDAAAEAGVKTCPRSLRNDALAKGHKDSGLASIRRKDIIHEQRFSNLDYRNALHEIIIRLLYETGCKVSELVELKKSHVRDDHIMIRDRRIRVSDKTIRLMKEQDDDSLCSGITVRRVQQICRSYGLSARVLRNTFAARMLKRFSHDEVSKMMGVAVNRFTYGI